MKLAERYTKALECIRQFRDEKGYSPSTRELAAMIGVTQTAAQRRIWALERFGKIKTTPGIPRSIVIL